VTYPCLVCGGPGWVMLDSKIYCKECYLRLRGKTEWQIKLVMGKDCK